MVAGVSPDATNGFFSGYLVGDNQPNWRPDHQLESLWGCHLELRFPICKLLDYPSWVESVQNPFAWLTAAHLQAQATQKHPELRAEIKFRLIRGLYGCGLTRAQMLELFRLLDWVLALPADLEYDFRCGLTRFEEEQRVVYVTSVERIARKEGLEAGRAEGIEAGRAEGVAKACSAIRQTIHERLEQRWGPVAQELKARLDAVDDFQRLLELHVQAATLPRLTDWLAQLEP